MLVWACIAPHGGEVIPELAGDSPERMAVTRRAMEELGRRCRLAHPETLVIFTPHGLCLENCISLSLAVIGAGIVDGANGVRIGMRFLVDWELSHAISEEAQMRGVPLGVVGYTSEGKMAPVFPLDWGVLVPAYFLGARWEGPPRIVVACPDRSLPRRILLSFGESVVHAAARLGRRVAIVCSADQGHGHAADGPYGFSPSSASHDEAYCAAIRDNALHRLLYWRNDRLESAMTDSYWQTLMLLGALRAAPLRPELLSYEAPTYFGMACAAFEPETPLP